MFEIFICETDYNHDYIKYDYSSINHPCMKYNIIKVYQGIVPEDENNITLVELCERCNSTPEIIIAMINEGIFDPVEEKRKKWAFSFSSIERIKKIQRLQKDLGLNLAGAALALQLLDEIRRLEKLTGDK